MTSSREFAIMTVSAKTFLFGGMDHGVLAAQHRRTASDTVAGVDDVCDHRGGLWFAYKKNITDKGMVSIEKSVVMKVTSVINVASFS